MKTATQPGAPDSPSVESVPAGQSPASRLSRLAWLPIPLLLGAVAALWTLHVRVVFESTYLLLALNFVFSTAVSLVAAKWIGQSFLARGTPGLLLIGCGGVIWGMAALMGTITGLAQVGPSLAHSNTEMTIHNACIWVSALCQLAGTILALRWSGVLRDPHVWLSTAYMVAVGVVGFIMLATLAGWLPPFFIPGRGMTLVWHFVLGSAIAILLSAAILLQLVNRRVWSPFRHWYSLALLLFVTGLFGALLAPAPGDLLIWLGRVARYLGSAYLLVAARAIGRESGARGLTRGLVSSEAPFQYGVAVAIVIAAAAVRLVFLQGLGSNDPYITFYPAVILAALYGGTGACVLATVVSILLADYFWIEPAGFGIVHPADWLGVAVFFLSGVMVSAIVETLHRTQKRARAAETAAKLAAERSQTQAARLQLAAIVESSDDAIISESLAGIVTTWNRGAEHLFGYAPAEIVGQPIMRLIAPDRHDEEERILERIRRGESIDHYETERLRKDGTVVAVSLTVSPLKDAAGIISGASKIARDITERKRTEAALAGERNLLRTLIDLLPDAIYIKDVESRFLAANVAVTQAMGAGTPHALLGKTDADFYPPELAAAYRADEQQILRTGQALIDKEEPRRNADGTIAHILTTKVPLKDAHGTIIGLVGIGRDITAWKTAEDALRKLNLELEQRVQSRTAELEETNRELEAFAYSVSHDLRAPLRSIDGFSAALLEDYGKQLDATGRDYLHRNRAACQRMAHLIEDLLNLSRLTRVPLQRELVDLSALAHTRAAEWQQTEPQRAVQWVIADHVTATGDPTLLPVVLDNLLGNAWKFTGQQPHPRIEFGVVNGSAAPERSFFVRDNGTGFDMAYADKLFAPFQRLHTQSEFPGTGIGLATVQRIIHRHGGQVWVDAAEGRGATFYFTLEPGGEPHEQPTARPDRG